MCLFLYILNHKSSPENRNGVGAWLFETSLHLDKPTKVHILKVALSHDSNDSEIILRRFFHVMAVLKLNF